MKNEKQDALTDAELEEVTGGLRAAQVDPSRLGDAGDMGAGNLSGDTVPGQDGHVGTTNDGPLQG